MLTPVSVSPSTPVLSTIAALARPDLRAVGATLPADFPEKFPDQQIFNESLSRGRRFNVFLGKLTEKCEEQKKIGL